MQRRPSPGWIVVAIAAAIGALATLAARAQQIVHEYVPDAEDDEGTILVSAGGPEPEAFVYDGEVIAAPAGGELGPDERAMQAVPGDAEGREEVGRRSPSFRPDRVTELHGEVGYFEVFTPRISPFKRVTALDGVTLASGGTPVLAIATRVPERTRVEVVGAQAPAPDWRPRDRFWGSVVLDFASGSVVPLPSVSPESRILTLRTEPRVALHVERDGADNFYAVLDDTSRMGEVRVVFLTDAPRTYFGTELPSVRSDALIAEVPELPPALERRALEFAGTLGLRRGDPFDTALERLGEHFRAFEESAVPPRDTGDIYWDLATGMRGVCRHRAYAFVITAQALGIAARFVQNEAHAWVEVHVPEGRGWLRIDLGGSPRGLRTHGTDDRPAYSPDVLDPIPRPEAYRRAYEEARATSEAEAAGSGAQAGAPGQAGPAAAHAGGTGGGGPEVPGAQEAGAGAAGGPDRPRVEVVEQRGSLEARAPLDLRLDGAPVTAVLRGRTLEVAGTARTGDVGVPGLRIEVLLSAERGTFERMLGVTVTNEHGVFRQTFGIPPDLAVGDYRLVVRSPGNQDVGPALAQ